MQRFEYKVVPAPRKGEKAKGLKTTPDRFAHALTVLMNDLGAEGWEYVRADTLPCEERVGLTGTKSTFQNMLVFRRPVLAKAEDADRPADTAATETMRAQRLTATLRDAVAGPRIGLPRAGAAPTLGPARTDHAAE